MTVAATRSRNEATAVGRRQNVANLLVLSALGTISGCMWFLATPPRRFFWFAWFAMIPVFIGLDRARNWRQAALVSWVAGTVTSLGGFSWMALLLERFAGLPRIAALGGLLLFSFYQGLTCLLFGLVAYRIRRHIDLPMTLVAAVVFVTFEWLVPLLFPWYLAITQAEHPGLIQVADLAGPLGISALLLVVNGVVYDLTKRGRRALKPAVIGALLIICALVYGRVRMRHFVALMAGAPKLAVGVVQPNIAYNQKGELHPNFRIEQLQTLQEQSRRLEQQGAQLIVWSETSYPYWLPRGMRGDLPINDPRRVMSGFNVPVIIGVNTYTRGGGEWNSAMLLDAQGAFTGTYDKMDLLAFGEALPSWLDFKLVRKMIPRGFGEFSPGEAARTLPYVAPDGRHIPVGAIICYEDILPQVLRKVGALHPLLLVNLTNDAWYGAGLEPMEHLALAVFGSVEQRTSMVRAVNSGISTFIDPNGRLVQKTEAIDPLVNPRPATSILVNVPLLEAGHTVFARVGNLFAYLCVAFTLILLASTFRKVHIPAPTKTASRRSSRSGLKGRGFSRSVPSQQLGL